MAPILRQLLSFRGSRFDLLRCSRRSDHSSLDRDYTHYFSVHLQTSPGDHAHLPAARLHSEIELVSPNGGAARAKASRDSHPTAAFLCAKRRQGSVAQVSSATSAGFPICD